ncbi:MAG: hypothetical protein EBT83_11960, partial [Betaproteobacteria bacterium]|nr:hypothetical protein [Betaproteobacteria bacterium]
MRMNVSSLCSLILLPSMLLSGWAWAQNKGPAVDDRAGASYPRKAIRLIAAAAPDGHTLLVNGPGGSYFSALYKKLPFDPDNDLAPVIQIARQPYALTLHPSVPANSVAEFVQLAKSRPGQLRYGNGGVGSA